MDVREIFQGIANQLITDFDEIQSQIEHSGERGSQREHAIRDLLSKYLPKKYSVGTGQIVDVKGNLSRQCDIVIYDAFNSPLLLVKEGYQIFPADAVFGIVEVKSILNAGKIKEGVQNIQAAKRLIRDEPLVGCIFAYRSDYKTEPKIETAGRALCKANQSIPPKERADLVCILTEGILMDYKGPPDWGHDESAIQVFLETRPPTLLLFLFFLIDLLSERNSSMADLIAYTGSGEIGIVKILPPTNM